MQMGKPLTIKLPADLDQSICPVLAVRQYLHNRINSDGPLFCHMDCAPVTRQQFSGVLAKCIRKTAFASGHYRSHSFRIGRATDLAAHGISNETIMLLGRWKSSCFKRYISM